MGVYPLPFFIYMNKASKIISEGILGNYSRNIQVGSKWYSMKQPTIPVIARIVRHWSCIDMADKHSVLSVISEIPVNSKPIIRGIAEALAGGNRIKYVYYRRVIRKLTTEQMKEAVVTIIELINGKDFFESASLARSATQIVAKPA